MRDPSDDEIEAALTGAADGPVADIVSDLRVAYRQPLVELTTARHLSAMRDAARAGSPRSRRGVLVAVAAAALAFVVLGAFGSAGALPDPVQDLVSDVADRVGLDFPSGDAETTPATESPSSTSVPEGTPPAPGQDPAGPGNSENPPGQDPAGPGNSENAPGQDPAGPGNSENAPGQGGTTPGQGGTPPGQGGTPPGQGGTPPGQGGTPPGQGGTPPGQGGTPPGEGGTPPGQDPAGPGNSENAPGQTERD